jgi:hypothetical protein
MTSAKSASAREYSRHVYRRLRRQADRFAEARERAFAIRRAIRSFHTAEIIEDVRAVVSQRRREIGNSALPVPPVEPGIRALVVRANQAESNRLVVRGDRTIVFSHQVPRIAAIHVRARE